MSETRYIIRFQVVSIDEAGKAHSLIHTVDTENAIPDKSAAIFLANEMADKAVEAMDYETRVTNRHTNLPPDLEE